MSFGGTNCQLPVSADSKVQATIHAVRGHEAVGRCAWEYHLSLVADDLRDMFFFVFK